MKKLNKRNMKMNTISAVLTVVFLVLLVLVNIGSEYLVDRFSLKLDLTNKNLYEISDETKEYIKKYQTDAIIIVTHDSQYTVDNTGLLAQVYESAKNLAVINPKITVEVVNIDTNPQFKSKYTNVNFDSTYPVIIETSLRYTSYTIAEMFQTSTSNYTGESYTYSYVEQCLASGLMFTSTESLPQMLVVNGHLEKDASAFVSLLEKNVFEVTTDKINTEKGIDEKYDIVAIFAPTRDYTMDEINVLNDFLNNSEKLNKNVMVFLDPSTPQLPNLEGYLKEWGIEVMQGIVYETDSDNIYFGYKTAFTAAYAENNYAGNLVGSSLQMLMYNARPMKALWTESGDKTLSPLLQTTNTTRYSTDVTGANINADNDEKGPFEMGYVSKKKLIVNNEELYSNVFVFASTDMLNDYLFSNSLLANSDYMLNVVNKLTGDVNTFKVVPKNISYEPLSVSQGTANFYMILLIIVLPLALLISGFVVWQLRRHR